MAQVIVGKMSSFAFSLDMRGEPAEGSLNRSNPPRELVRPPWWQPLPGRPPGAGVAAPLGAVPAGRACPSWRAWLAFSHNLPPFNIVSEALAWLLLGGPADLTKDNSQQRISWLPYR